MVATIQHTDPVIVLLTIDGETLETTADHPFYTAYGEWVEAADLAVGDDIRTLDGDTGEVEAVEAVEQSQAMYNLTVDEAHTFFVGDGQWLVHNLGCQYWQMVLTPTLRLLTPVIPMIAINPLQRRENIPRIL